MPEGLVKSADLQGKQLIGMKSVKLGVIREAYIDLDAGTVAYLVVEAAGLFKGAGKFQPIPWAAVRYDGIADVFLAEVDKEQFKAAPSYDREQLANANYGWNDQVSRYFSGTATSQDGASFQRQ
jgi:sporulation protein YlmC with PRC-barrel domain